MLEAGSLSCPPHGAALSASLPSSLPRPILVALGPDAQALRLVQAAFWAARETGRPWLAIHVQVEGAEDADDRGQADLWLREAEGLGARTQILRASTVGGGLQEAVRREGTDLLILGRKPDRGLWSRVGASLDTEMVRRLPGIEVRAIPLVSGIEPERLLPPPGRRVGALVATPVLLLAATGLGSLLPPEANLPAIFLLYLLATALAAEAWGRLAGLLGVAASGVLFDLVFDSHPGSLDIGNLPLMVLFLAILMGGQIAVGLSDRLRREGRASRRREALMASLLLLGRRLTQARDPHEVAQALAEVTQRLLGHPVRLAIPDGSGGWQGLPDAEALHLPSKLLSQLEPNTTAGGPPPILRAEGAGWLPLVGPGGLEGLLCLPVEDRPLPAGSALDLLHAAAAQVALALERLHWLEAAHASHIAHESERLRSGLLGAISHDLRTPLAAIHGAAASLLLSPDLPEATRHDLLAMVRDESDRLAHLLANLLELTRLEGPVALAKEWHPLDEIVASALTRAEAKGGALDLSVDLGEEPPLVHGDAVLLEQLLLNLLANARRHAPDSPIHLAAEVQEGEVVLTVRDQGPGIPPAFRQRIFEKFVRLPGSRADGGAGLGLAICEAVARAHGGTIQAQEAPGGGALFEIRLPQPDCPPPLPEDLT